MAVPERAQKPKRFDRNLIVIGAGSAGLVSAYIAAMVKAKVTLIEAHEMGGDCLNTGCVPSKALIKSAKVAHQIVDAARFGIDVGAPRIDFPAVMRRVRDVITTIEPHDSVERFTGLGVDCVKGYARFLDPWTVEIDGERQLTAKSFIIATGAAPLIPPLPGVEDSGYLTSETLWDAMATRAAAPDRLVILGGGPIGCELAQAFQRLGSNVTIVEMADRLLLKEDADAAALVTARLESEGVSIRTKHRALRFETGKTLAVAGPEGEAAIAYDDIIIAVGRKPRVSGFGLEELGLVVDGRLENDVFLRTSMPHITQAEAEEQGASFDVTRYDLDDLDRAIAESEAHGFVKILTAKGSDRILGATIIGQNAGEILAEVTFAMKHNMGLRKILQTIHPYPTWAEANKYAAGQYGLARKPVALLKWAERWFRWQRG